MLERIVTVQYLDVKSNFCYLGPGLTKDLGTDLLINVFHGDNRQECFYVCTPSPIISDNTIGISFLHARLLGIEENASVILRNIGPLPKILSFTINPVRFDDYLVLDLMRNEVETCVLKQTKVVSINKAFVIWIGENLNIPVEVVAVVPNSPGILDNLTEMIILPPDKKTKLQTNSESDQESFGDIKETQQQKSFDNELFNISQKLTVTEEQMTRKMQFYLNRRKCFNGRLVPFECLQFSNVSKYLFEFSVFITKENAPLSWKKTDSFNVPILCSLEIVNNADAKTIFVRVFLIENNPSLESTNIYVHQDLFIILNCKIGVSAILKASTNISSNEQIVIRGGHNRINLKDLLKEYLANICQYQEFVLNPDVPIALNNSTYCSLKFKPYSKYCWVDKEFLRNCKYSIDDDSFICKQPEPHKPNRKLFFDIPTHKNICDHIFNNLKMNLSGDMQICSSLITGSIGSGKSTIIDKIESSLLQAPFFVHPEVVRSKILKGKTLDSLYRIFVSISENLVAHQPSILFIDDLHVLCESIAENDAQAQSALYYDRISEMLYSLFTSVKSHHRVGIIATIESMDKLNKSVYSSRGSKLFECVYHIEDLMKNDRNKILRHLLKDYKTEIDFEWLSQKTEGYVFQDLFDFCQKAVFHSLKKGPENVSVVDEDCENTLSQMTILSLNNAKLYSSEGINFSNVGGLVDIKKMLIEDLLWPQKYPNLFETAPLRLQSGLLMYGPPGTGKTLLAAAVAKQCGIRLISIKGPELLSKYIGASELAIRNVFKQAQNAKPCILFFDEFDSLAARRGHDITGVTDRVVNQLLTQMDGVESLSGVFVLAATSRPDLLDPALLRPGRLDKQIFFALPDLESRLDIIKILSKSLKFSDDINLKEIAEKTEGFSGADLQSLLYNAQSSSMEHLFMSDKTDMESKPITQELLRRALTSTRPSLTEEERNKYYFIYSKFQGKTDVSYLKPGSRASFA